MVAKLFSLAGSTTTGCATALLLAVSLLVTGCARSSPQDRIVVTGASTVYPIVQMAAEKLRATGALEIQAEAGGSTRGFEDCIAGRNDLGEMARDLTPAESRQVTAYPIAYDGVAFVVHTSNPIAALTTAQIRRLYTRDITNWSNLTHWSGPVTLVNKAEGHATLDDFLNHVKLTRADLKSDAVGGDNAQIIRLVANTPTAIAYVSIGEAIHAQAIGIPIHLVVLDGVEPTLANIANDTYPIRRMLYLISKSTPNRGSRLLLDYLGSPAGKELIRQGMYVPLN